MNPHRRRQFRLRLVRPVVSGPAQPRTLLSGTSKGVPADMDDADEVVLDSAASVPLVAIGASAGGIEALKTVLADLPAGTGACYVVIQHLEPSHKSLLVELLARITDLPVEVARDGARALPDRIVVLPENATLTLHAGHFVLRHPAPPRDVRRPIDTFLGSMALELGERGAAILLSGAGSDGTQGIRALKETGGFAIVQDPATATHDSLPRNAIATGLIDVVLPPREIPAAIASYLRHLSHSPAPLAIEDSDTRSDLMRICQLLKRGTGHDFRLYKEPTLLRRIQRRMQVLGVQTLAAYAERLRGDRHEARQLFREMLIGVTAFFRDPEAFTALEAAADRILLRKPGADPVRAWVAGCATGEEAYSLAMLLREKSETREHPPPIQIFATDIDEEALAVARRGIYPESVVAGVPEAYLDRYFRVRDGHYEVLDEIRELCIFSTHSLVRDPPFSRLDLLSCRNVLIYFKPELQDRLIPLFHYALRPDGCLLLGPSESITGHERLFEVVDKKWRLFRARAAEREVHPRFPLGDLRLDRGLPQPVTNAGRAGRVTGGVVDRARQILLDEVGPAYAIVKQTRELLYTGGPIRDYLAIPAGAPSLDVLTLVHPSLRMDLRALWHGLTGDGTATTRDGVAFDAPGGRRGLRLIGRPVGEDGLGHAHFLIAFHDLGPLASDRSRGNAGTHDPTEAQLLASELSATRAYLKSATEELETANEELKAANEELMSMNEELQSSNEELETSKEELQSVNEELETVNAELTGKVVELGHANADLANLLESIEIATIFLDREARVRRFTPPARRVFRLISADIGRPIADISARVADVDLSADVQQVLEGLTPVEREVALRDGDGTFLMRLFPYRSVGDEIDGAVATFVDISGQKADQVRIAELARAHEAQVADLSALLELAPIGVIFADDPDFAEIQLNAYGMQMTGLPDRTGPPAFPDPSYTISRDGEPVPPDDLPLQTAWRTRRPVFDFRATFNRRDGQSFEMLMSAAPVFDRWGEVRRVIGILNDITGFVAAQSEAERRALKHAFVAELGVRSLAGLGTDALVTEIPARIAEVLDVELAKVLLCRSGQSDLVLASEHGFDVPAGTHVANDTESHSGYTLGVGEPVVVEDLAIERRFAGSFLLRSSGAVSGISVIIGDPRDPLGVIGAHSRSRRTFTRDDHIFLQSVANVLASALRRDAADRQKKLLLDELRHRVKNMLATVQSVTALTLRNSAADPSVIRRVADRLQALALAHDLNFHREDEQVDLRELIDIQCRPYDPDRKRVTIKGKSRVALSPNVAIDVSMVIHELVTNAIKHGALSRETGEVSIALGHKHSDAGASTVTIDWQEISDPPPEPTFREGSGTRLLHALGALPHLDLERGFNDSGFQCHVSIHL